MSAIPAPGVQLIKQFEGCHLKAYPDPLTKAEPYTIGWGSTQRKDGSPFRLGEEITQAEADDLLMWQIERHFLPSLRKIPKWSTYTPEQAGAVLSFAYNLGAHFYGSSGFETISRVLRNQQWDEVEYAFSLYRNPGSNVEEGLLRRRATEARTFLAGLGRSLSAAGTEYLSAAQRTYTQNPQLSDQALRYLAALKGNPAPTVPTPRTPPPPPTTAQPRLLYLDTPPMTGADVRAIQEALARTGAGVVVDGVFGPATALAVERFQRVNGLPVDGVVGEKTRSLLLQRPLFLTSPPMTGADVETLQRSLQARGISVAVDGVFGPGTKAAVETFQRWAGIFIDGIAGPRTIKLLSIRTLRLTTPHLQGEDVRLVQKALVQAGLSVGVDGVFGPGTEWAIKQFQTRHHLIPDGIVGPRTAVKLGF